MTPKDLKRGDLIKFKENDDSEWAVAKVISRAGKQTGRNKSCLNVQIEEEHKCVNLDQVTSWESLEQDTPARADLGLFDIGSTISDRSVSVRSGSFRRAVF